MQYAFNCLMPIQGYPAPGGGARGGRKTQVHLLVLGRSANNMSNFKNCVFEISKYDLRQVLQTTTVNY